MNAPQNDSLGVGAQETSLGARLRAARIARSLSIADVAAALRTPQSVVDAVEEDSLDRLGAPVFVRGYLLSYAKLVGMPSAVIEVALARPQPPQAPLRSAVHVPRSRYLLDRYARRGAYLVLTALIVLPVIRLATQDQLPLQQLGLRSLDAPSEPSGARVGDTDVLRVVGGNDENKIAAVAGEIQADGAIHLDEPVDEGDMTVMASMTPFYGQRASAVRTPEPTVGPIADSRELPISAAGWQLRLENDSWVEIIDVDGSKLESGLLRAGSLHSYPAGRVRTVALGNAAGVELLHNGTAVDFAPFQRANVVRFAVSSDGELRPVGN